MWVMGNEDNLVATGSTHTMPSYHALNFAWGEHCVTCMVSQTTGIYLVLVLPLKPLNSVPVYKSVTMVQIR